MNPTAHHPQQLLDSSWRILEHVRTSLSSTVWAANLGTIAGDISISSRDSRRFQVLQRSRRRLSAPFGRSQRQKCGRSGNLSLPLPSPVCKLNTPLVFQRTAAIANLHARLLESQPNKHFTTPPPTYSIPRLHIPSPVSPPRSHSPYSPSGQHSDSSYEPSRSHRPTLSPRPTKRYRRSPYERPTQVADDDARYWGSKYSYDSHKSPSGSDASSPRSREAMSIGTLLSTQNAQLDEDERGVSSERSTSRKVSP